MPRRAAWFGRLANSGAFVTILLAPVAFMAPLLTGSGILVDYDLFSYFYPYREAVRQALSEGRLPLWNPLLFMGAPLLANPQTAIFYPFNALTWWMEPPYQVSLSVLIHVQIAGMLAYALARWGFELRPLAALAGALTYMFSGFLWQQAGHINQLNASAWLPGLVLALLLAVRRGSWTALGLGAIGVATQFLAGHTQEFYLSMVGLSLTALWLALRVVVLDRGYRRRHGRARAMAVAGILRRRAAALAAPFVALAVMGMAGLALAGIQLIPTLELSALSARGGGLPFSEGRSFSLPPWLLLWALMPGYAHHPFSEFIAYVGLSGLALAITGVLASRRRLVRNWAVGLVIISVFFALGGFNPLYEPLYGVIPGLNLFRVPARWLFLYTLGASVLVGLGVQELLVRGRRMRRPVWRWQRVTSGPARWMLAMLAAAAGASALAAAARFSLIPPEPTPAIWVIGVPAMALGAVAAVRTRGRWMVAAAATLVLLVDLFLASRTMAYTHTVPPDAWTQVRPAVAFLRDQPGLFRILSIADTRYVPGDEAQLVRILEPTWSRRAVVDMLGSLKLTEVVSANTNLTHRLATIDGYDGGVLPLVRYILFKQRLLESGGLNRDAVNPVDPAQPDGILRFQLDTAPDGWLLAALNVGYVVADKLFDAWVDGVYYDLSLRKVLRPGERVVLTALADTPATGFGVVSHLQQAAALSPGTPVARVLAWLEDGQQVDMVLRAGIETAEGERRQPAIAHGEARRANRWRASPTAYSYLITVDLPTPARIVRIEITSLLDAGEVHLRGLSTFDRRLDLSTPIVVNPDFTLVRDGDTKIYAVREVRPRALLVDHWVHAADPWLADQVRTDLAYEAVVEGPEDPVFPPVPAEAPRLPHTVTIRSYAPEAVTLDVAADRPSLLLFTEANYPGWRVYVNGEERPLLTANVLFRGVVVPYGRHEVVMRYEPESLRQGGILSGYGVLLTALVMAMAAMRGLVDIARRTPYAVPARN